MFKPFLVIFLVIITVLSVFPIENYFGIVNEFDSGKAVMLFFPVFLSYNQLHGALGIQHNVKFNSRFGIDSLFLLSVFDVENFDDSSFGMDLTFIVYPTIYFNSGKKVTPFLSIMGIKLKLSPINHYTALNNSRNEKIEEMHYFEDLKFGFSSRFGLDSALSPRLTLTMFYINFDVMIDKKIFNDHDTFTERFLENIWINYGVGIALKFNLKKAEKQ
jgi:hypothetical protein